MPLSHFLFWKVHVNVLILRRAAAIQTGFALVAAVEGAVHHAQSIWSRQNQTDAKAACIKPFSLFQIKNLPQALGKVN